MKSHLSSASTFTLRFLRVLVGGLFLGLVASQSLMDGFLVLSSLSAIFLIFKNKDLTFFKPYRMWIGFLLIWWIYLVGSFLIKSPPGTSLKPLLLDSLWMLVWVLFVYLWYLIRPDKKLGTSLVAILFLVSLYAVVIYFLGFDPLQQNWSDRIQNRQMFWRSGGFFSNPMSLAQSYGPLVMLLLPLSFYSLISRVYKLPKSSQASKLPATSSSFLIITFILVTLAVLFTFTRGVWLSLGLATIVGGFIWNKRWGVATLLTLFLSTLLLLGAWPKFRERTLLVFDAQKSYDSERMVLWKTNWFIFTENPLLGIGYGENKRRLREYYDLLGVPPQQFEGHAHNQYLHFLAGTGLIGFLFYLIWCATFLKITYVLYRRYEKPQQMELKLLSLGLLLAQVAFHLGSFTEANFNIAKNRLLLVLMWSFVFYLYQQQKSPSTIAMSSNMHNGSKD